MATSLRRIKKLAKRYAEEGKKAGDLLAALNVGYATRRGTLTQRRIFRQYMPQVEALAKTGDVLAMYEMADAYRVGLARKVNEKKRWAWNKKCMKAGLWQSRIRWASHLLFDKTLASDMSADGETLLKEIAEEPKASAGEAARTLRITICFRRTSRGLSTIASLPCDGKISGAGSIWDFIMRMATA